MNHSHSIKKCEQPCQEIEYRLNTIDTANEGKEGKIVLVNAPVRIKNSLFKNLGFAQIELAGLSM